MITVFSHARRGEVNSRVADAPTVIICMAELQLAICPEQGVNFPVRIALPFPLNPALRPRKLATQRLYIERKTHICRSVEVLLRIPSYSIRKAIRKERGF